MLLVPWAAAGLKTVVSVIALCDVEQSQQSMTIDMVYIYVITKNMRKRIQLNNSRLYVPSTTRRQTAVDINSSKLGVCGVVGVQTRCIFHYSRCRRLLRFAVCCLL